jgi:hypothetical protein
MAQPVNPVNRADGGAAEWRRWQNRMTTLTRVAWGAVSLLGAAVAVWMLTQERTWWWVPLLIGPGYALGGGLAWLLVRCLRSRSAERSPHDQPR